MASENRFTYPRFAAFALPPLLVAVVCLAFRDHDRRAGAEPPPPTEIASAAASPSSASSQAAEVFGNIYRSGFWGHNDAGQGWSGTGSSLEATAVYRHYLQSFMKQHGIASVVDAGCGDWEFSKTLDWNGVDYKGYDVVPSVVEKDTATYGAENVHFFVANIVTDDLPAADLLLVKEVLQHLPNADIQRVFGKLGKYKHVLLTNVVDKITLSADNRDIAIGDFRELDPTKAPFRLPGAKELSWWDSWHMQQVVHLERATKR